MPAAAMNARTPVQMLIACLRIDERSSSGDHGPDNSGGADNRQPSTHRRTDSHGEPSTADTSQVTSSGTTTPPSHPGAPLAPPGTAVVEFMGGADAKAEELVVLTGAPSLREVGGAQNVEGIRGRRGGNSGGGGDDDEGSTELLELRGGVWEHIGLPRQRIVDVLQWAQRQLTGAEDLTSAEFTVSPRLSEGGGWEKRDGERLRESGGSSVENKRRLEEEAAAKTVARVTMEVLQGLLIGQLPRGFATRVMNSRDGGQQQRDSKISPVDSPATNQPLDPFFMETSAGSAAGDSGSGDRSGAGTGHTQRSRPRSWQNGQARSPGSSGAIPPPPLCIRLPEAFPALCQQVAMAPLGAALRGEVVETLVAAVQSQTNAACVLSVDSWQQYLLSVVSSAQGRQAVATAATAAAAAAGAATRSVRENGSETTEWPSRADSTADDGDTGWHERQSAREEAAREARLVDRTVKLICWLAMCKARSGRPGRPGAGFAELRDTMSFLRCQAELGTMECMSVGEKMLGHMVRRNGFHTSEKIPSVVCGAAILFLCVDLCGQQMVKLKRCRVGATLPSACSS